MPSDDGAAGPQTREGLASIWSMARRQLRPTRRRPLAADFNVHFANLTRVVTIQLLVMYEQPDQILRVRRRPGRFFPVLLDRRGVRGGVEC